MCRNTFPQEILFQDRCKSVKPYPGQVELTFSYPFWGTAFPSFYPTGSSNFFTLSDPTMTFQSDKVSGKYIET